MYINKSVNNDSKKLTPPPPKKKTHCDPFGKLTTAVYAPVVYVYTCCTCMPSWLEYNSLFVGLGGWGVRGSE
jgi:hypothetical protein